VVKCEGSLPEDKEKTQLYGDLDDDGWKWKTHKKRKTQWQKDFESKNLWLKLLSTKIFWNKKKRQEGIG